MVAFCRDRGLSVARADLFDHLQDVADASLDGIFAAQLVEHLPPEQIFRLGEVCAAKLAPGGIAVLETINSDCPAAMAWFYLDPTHVRPVPARLLRFMFEQHGLTAARLRFTSPVPGSGAPPMLEVSSEYPPEVTLYQDYALVASRA
jgi:hypothetical protein